MRAGVVVALLAGMALVALPAGADQGPPSGGGGGGGASSGADSGNASYHHVCGQVPAGYARCHAIRVDQSTRSGRSSAKKPGGGGTTSPAASARAGSQTDPCQALSVSFCYGADDLRSAYNLPAMSGVPGSGPTVAVVDAFDDPTAQSDLDQYRSTFHLGACDAGCFSQVNESGATFPLPAPNPDWDTEISLDLDMVSAACPACKITLVEANTNLTSDLFTAENTAVALGAVAVSNSWGSGEYQGETDDSQTYFNHPGVVITASAGDSGYGVSYPAASRYVTSVGGTTLNFNPSAPGSTTGTYSESAWNGTGSGCSAYEPKPSWQKDSGCRNRTDNDVSAEADPNTPVEVVYGGQWIALGGTSVSSPFIAGVYAAAGNATSVNYGSYPYGHTSSLFDVTTGTNGPCNPDPAYLCTAGTGYDGPTGLGTPNGTGAF